MFSTDHHEGAVQRVIYYISDHVKTNNLKTFSEKKMLSQKVQFPYLLSTAILHYYKECVHNLHSVSMKLYKSSVNAHCPSTGVMWSYIVVE